jgi:hypothetical protein
MQNQAAILATMLSMTAAQIRDVQDADLWVTEPEVECFDQVKAMRDIHLLRVRGIAGIAWAAPLLKIDAIGHSEGGRLNTVTVLGIDDASLFLSRFENGSLGSFEATRYARGHKALYTLEINGEHASIFWDLHDLHRLQYFDHRDEGRTRGWRSVHITDGDHPYMNKWWVPGLQIGYEHTFIHQAADFIEGLTSGKPAAPTFRDALATDLVTDAVLRNLELLGEAAKQIPDAVRHRHPDVPWRRIVGLLFSALAEFERNLIRERTMAGLQAARSRGRVGGRKREMTPEKVKIAARWEATK